MKIFHVFFHIWVARQDVSINAGALLIMEAGSRTSAVKRARRTNKPKLDVRTTFFEVESAGISEAWLTESEEERKARNSRNAKVRKIRAFVPAAWRRNKEKNPFRRLSSDKGKKHWRRLSLETRLGISVSQLPFLS